MKATSLAILACAVCRLFPEAKLLGGGMDAIGVYYDFVVEQRIESAFISRIEELIRGIIKEDVFVEISEMMRENASALFLHLGQPLKAEEAEGCLFNILSVFSIGTFRDLALASYLPSTGEVPSIRILDISTYSRYVESMGSVEVTRVYGAVVSEKKEFKKVKKNYTEAKKRSHLLVGQEKALFRFASQPGGAPLLWLGEGVRLVESLLSFLQEAYRDQGFEFSRSPPLSSKASLKLEERDLFMLAPKVYVEGEELCFASAPVHTHVQLFLESSRSFLESPRRYVECVEKKDFAPADLTLGLLQSHVSTADIATIFCLPEQVEEEIISSLQFFLKIVSMVGAECRWRLLSRKRKSSVSEEDWRRGRLWLEKALKACDIVPEEAELRPCHLSPHVNAPQLELYLLDAFGREWCISRLRLNFYLPAQLDLCYLGKNNFRHLPVMIERSTLVSLERTIALILESCCSALPFWMTPKHFLVIPVSEGQLQYAKKVSLKMQQSGYRSGVDTKSLSLGAKIHAAERAKIPYILVVGEKEKAENVVSVRCSWIQGSVSMSLEELLQAVGAKELMKPLIGVSNHVES